MATKEGPASRSEIAGASAAPTPGRGRLRTYLGIAPGVGKTYTMLRDGRAAARNGADVVVGFVERHGRAGTRAQMGSLEVVAPKEVPYRGSTFLDLDVDAVLARRPELVLVDELARTTVGGHRRERRWQDVDHLLANGIDVFTTVNLGSLESLRQLIARITDTAPAEPVPDGFVRAGEVRLVDLPSAALRRRLTQGLVYPSDGVEAALSHYFRYANLAALRELAQLWMDDSVTDAAAAYLVLHGGGERQANRVVVGLQGSGEDEWLIRYAANVAGVNGARLRGIYVHPDDGLLPPAAQLARDRQLLEELGGSYSEARASNVAHGLVRAARRANASQLVIGSPAGGWWSRMLKGGMVRRILKAAGDLPVQLVCVGEEPGAEQA
jgi:two-component system sensor histidine kinase KdpD